MSAEVEVEPPVYRTYPTMHDAGFPFGLRCPSCERNITDGQPYAQRPSSVADGSLFSVLTCVYCADYADPDEQATLVGGIG